jgi:hypothetical protein
MKIHEFVMLMIFVIAYTGLMYFLLGGWETVFK